MFRKFGFIMAATILGAMPAAAQDVKPVQLTIGGGYTSVLGPVRDHIANGGNFTIGVLFNTQSPVSIQAEYGWNGFMQKQLSIDTCATNPCTTPHVPTDFFADGNMQYFDVNGLFHAKTSGKTQPYGIVGLGYYHRPVNVTTPGVGYTTICDPWWYVCYPGGFVPVENIIGERSSTDFGMNFGGGVNVALGESASFYVEARYHYIWGPQVQGATGDTKKANGQFFPITFGFRF